MRALAVIEIPGSFVSGMERVRMSEISEVGSVSVVFSLPVWARMSQWSILKVSSVSRS